MKHEIINTDCLRYLSGNSRKWDTVFADPPDNMGLKYDGYDDNLPDGTYKTLIHVWLQYFTRVARCAVWFSFNAKHYPIVAKTASRLRWTSGGEIELKWCVQTFTFGQHNSYDLGNCYRPLLRILHKGAELYPDRIRVESKRQKAGDKRADPRGRVPGDVFDFPRVTGNSSQRRKWHKTQLHEDLVRRCLLLTTPQGGTVLDPFAGTGTVLRVCKFLQYLCLDCTSIEISKAYCEKMRDEHEIPVTEVCPVSTGPGQSRHSDNLPGQAYLDF